MHDRKAVLSSVIIGLVVLLLPAAGFGHGNEEPSPQSHSDGPEKPSIQTDPHSPAADQGGTTVSHTDEHSQTDHGHENGSRVSWYQQILPGFFGAPNLHPLLVHFPIVFFWSALFFAGLGWWRGSGRFEQTTNWLFWAGLITLPLTAASGFWAIGGWGKGHVRTHRNLMLVTLGLAGLLFIVLRLLSERDRLYRIILTIGLILVVTTMTLGADRGAWLVFVEGSGVKPVKHTHQHDSTSD